MLRIPEILENVDESIITTGKEGTITSWNRAAERLYGIASDEALGRLFETLVSVEDAAATTEEILRESEAKGRWRGEVVHRTRDGRRLWVDWTVIWLVVPELDICGTIEVSRDISRYKDTELALREKGDFLESVIEGSTEGIFVLDDQIKYTL